MLEINQAKAPVLLPVSDVPHVMIIMPDPILFQLINQFLLPGSIQMFHPGTAIGGYNSKPVRIGLQQTGNKWTTPCLQVLEHPHLILKSLPRLMPPIGFQYAAIKAQVDRRSERIFDLEHDSL